MSDLSKALGLDKNPVLLGVLNSVGNAIAQSHGISVGNGNIQIGAGGPVIPVNSSGLKVVFHTLIHGITIEGIDPGLLTVIENAIESKVDGYIDAHAGKLE